MLADHRLAIWIDCPWCNIPQVKNVFKSGMIETVCVTCDKAIGIETLDGVPTHVGFKVLNFSTYWITRLYPKLCTTCSASWQRGEIGYMNTTEY